MKTGANGFAGSAWQMLSASLMFWLCVALSGEWGEVAFRSVPPSAWWSLLYLITFGSLPAYRIASTSPFSCLMKPSIASDGRAMA